MMQTWEDAKDALWPAAFTMLLATVVVLISRHYGDYTFGFWNVFHIGAGVFGGFVAGRMK